MDTDGQPPALTAGAGLEARGDRLRFLDDASGGIEKFLTFCGRSTAAVGALEEGGAQLIFEIPQASTECGLPYVEGLSRLPQTSMLGCDDGPAQISKLDSHRLRAHR